MNKKKKKTSSPKPNTQQYKWFYFKFQFKHEASWSEPCLKRIIPANNYLFKVNNRNTKKGKQYVQS